MSFSYDTYMDCVTDEKNLTDEYNSEMHNGDHAFQATLKFLDDVTFKKLCKENGLDVKEYMNPDKPLGIFYNHYTTHESGRVKNFRVIKSDSFPLQIIMKADAEAREKRSDLTLTIGAEVKERQWFDAGRAVIWYPLSMMDTIYGSESYETQKAGSEAYDMQFKTADHAALKKTLTDERNESAFTSSTVRDNVAEQISSRMLMSVIEVFIYGFIILISLIAVTNVFNMISTGVILRRREFAMLRSIGMSEKDLNRMLTRECMIYGTKAMTAAIPVSIAVTFLIYEIVRINLEMPFYMPIAPLIIGTAAVFTVIFLTMRYAERKVGRENLIDALRNC